MPVATSRLEVVVAMEVSVVVAVVNKTFKLLKVVVIVVASDGGGSGPAVTWVVASHIWCWWWPACSLSYYGRRGSQFWQSLFL